MASISVLNTGKRWAGPEPLIQTALIAFKSWPWPSMTWQIGNPPPPFSILDTTNGKEDPSLGTDFEYLDHTGIICPWVAAGWEIGVNCPLLRFH